jgi:hypothetical protein
MRFCAYLPDWIDFLHKPICDNLCFSDLLKTQNCAILAMARIIHFGEDNCHRLMVLEGVGYAVERCESIQDIEFYLRSPLLPDAVVISGELHRASRLATFLSNADLPLPVILFAGTDESYTETEYDLIIPALTSPSDWLLSIEETIERFQGRPSDISEHHHSEHASQGGLL